MAIASDAQQRIEAYLSRLRGRLYGISDEEVREIVEECAVTLWRRPRPAELMQRSTASAIRKNSPASI
jgi:hypothetical protein